MEEVAGIKRRSIYEKNKSFTNRIQRENSVFPEKNALSASIRKFVVRNSKKKRPLREACEKYPRGKYAKNGGNNLRNYHFQIPELALFG